jgi:hypothetical protein
MGKTTNADKVSIKARTKQEHVVPKKNFRWLIYTKLKYNVKKRKKRNESGVSRQSREVLAYCI